jgi:hypothetical protein
MMVGVVLVLFPLIFFTELMKALLVLCVFGIAVLLFTHGYEELQTEWFLRQLTKK